VFATMAVESHGDHEQRAEHEEHGAAATVAAH
jgi:hypothetical protein